jgi:hypothetical protein
MMNTYSAKKALQLSALARLTSAQRSLVP